MLGALAVDITCGCIYACCSVVGVCVHVLWLSLIFFLQFLMLILAMVSLHENYLTIEEVRSTIIHKHMCGYGDFFTHTIVGPF